MRHWKHRRGGGNTPSIDSAFADALAGKSGKSWSRSESRSHQKQNYKALQLCRQVQRILSLALWEAGDDLLREVSLADVVPAAGSSQLLVFVSVPAHLRVVDVLERLERAAPRLRAEVASAITRKRAPELSFIPAPAGAQGVGHE